MKHRKNDRAIHAALLTPGWYENRILPYLSETPDGCIEWTGKKTNVGYGMARIPCSISGTKKRVEVGVHRVAWIRSRGPIPGGLVIDHDGPTGCHNRLCSNPDHLMTATEWQNIIGTGSGITAINARKTECLRGHPLSGPNLIVRASGRRGCRACRDESSRQDFRAIAAAASVLGISTQKYRATYGNSRRRATEFLVA